MMSIQLRAAFVLGEQPAQPGRSGRLDLASTGSIWLPDGVPADPNWPPDVPFLVPPAVREASSAPQASTFELETYVFSRFRRARSLPRANRAT